MLANTSLFDVVSCLPDSFSSFEWNNTARIFGLLFLIGLLHHFLAGYPFDASSECCWLIRALCTIQEKLIQYHPCPKRRARYYKCAKRCARRRSCECPEEQTSTTTVSCRQCCLSAAFYKLHLPPPLPFMKKNKRTKITEETKAVNMSIETVVAESGITANGEDWAIRRASAVPRGVTPHRTPLIDLARMQQWKAVLQQVNRKEAKYRDGEGLYALHWACSGSPPVEVVQALLDSYPSAARKVDREGSTALHFATHYSASIQVVEALIKMNPKAISVQDKHGRTPLFHAVDKSAGLDVLKLLIKTDPTMILQPCLPKSERNNALTRSAAVRTPLFMAWAAVAADHQSRTKKQGRKWDKAVLLLQVAAASQKQNFRLLFEAIRFDLYLPEQTVSLAIQAHPEQLETIYGESALLLASSLNQYSSERSRTLLEELLNGNPRAAAACDTRRRSSLVLAVQAGKHWDSLKILWQAYPDALQWRSGGTGLPPALAAAVDQPTAINPVPTKDDALMISMDPFRLLSSKQHEWLMALQQRTKQVEAPPGIDPATQQTNTIYELLRADPSVIRL